MKLSDFDYKLPEELIAQYPLERRDGSRMMVLERAAHKIYEKKFADIAGYLSNILVPFAILNCQVSPNPTFNMSPHPPLSRGQALPSPQRGEGRFLK